MARLGDSAVCFIGLVDGDVEAVVTGEEATEGKGAKVLVWKGGDGLVGGGDWHRLLCWQRRGRRRRRNTRLIFPGADEMVRGPWVTHCLLCVFVYLCGG